MYRRAVRVAVAVIGGLITQVYGSPAEESSGTATQILAATLNPVGSISVAANASLTPGSTAFQPFSGNVAVNYLARTTPTGSGTITLTVSSDFTPSGGPSAANGALKYTCSGATLGAACSGTQTASPSAQSSVLTLPASACTGGGGACSSGSPNTVNLNFTLTDDPGYATGTYSAKVLLTISTT